jgi:hypothetical protein
MSLSRREILALGAVAAPAGLLLAQPPTVSPPPRPGIPPAGTPPTRVPSGRDPLLAACLLIGGRVQTEVCQWAQTRLTSEDVKAFCKAEIDHQETAKARLKEFGFDYPTRSTGVALASGTADTGGVVQAGGLPRVEMVSIGRIALPGAASEMVHIEHEVAEQCLKTFKEMMGKKSGVKFDKAFVGCQLSAHIGMKDKLEVFQRHASESMKPVLAECLTHINRDIETLETLMARMDTTLERDPGRREPDKGERKGPD